MHSSRMRSARSSSRPGGSVSMRAGLDPPGVGLETPLNFPLGCGLGTPPARSLSTSPLGVGLETPWPDPPQLPPLVWAWRPPPGQMPLNFPLGVGLETCKACWDTTPRPPRDLLQGMLGYHLQCMLGYHPAPPRPAARHAGIPPAMHAGIPPPSPVDRMTDTCKNITLRKLRLRAVIIFLNINNGNRYPF